jgi:hypothetical protein
MDDGLVYVVRSRVDAESRVGKTRVYLRRDAALARARHWRDAGYVVSVEASDADFRAIEVEVE